MASFGEGLGDFFGAGMAKDDIKAGINAVAGADAGFQNRTQPYNEFGQSFLAPAGDTIGEVKDAARSTMGYNQFMQGYENTPAARYQLQQADAVQNNSAAARGGILAGSNLRALGTINSGIVAQNANTAYSQYLAGNSQQFGQLETALGNMFNAIGIGEVATGQQATVDVANMNNQTKLAEAQAKNSQKKGSGIGSMFSGIGSAFAAF